MRYCQVCRRCFHDGIEYCPFEQTPTRAGGQTPLVIDGKYRLEQLIAHGGMGSVYRAVHEQLERPVAVKILRPEYLADRKVRARFHREALAAARLKHPNIVAVYDFGILDERADGSAGAYIVMELIEGRSLREEMRLSTAHDGQLRPERIAAILRQVCAGIDAAHQHGIIHRDLKPDNIMLEPDPEGGERVLVLDFGIAKLKQPDGAPQCLTDEDTIIGTPNYISPEQCTGLPVDERSDVYALGVILYELLTGRAPFSGQSTSAVLLSHLQTAPTPPSRFRPHLSPALEQVALRALAKSPQHRPAGALQFAAQLTAAVGGEADAEPVEEFDDEPDEPTTRARWPVAPPPAPVIARPPAAEQPGHRPGPQAEQRPEQDDADEDAPLVWINAEIDAPRLLLDERPRRRVYALFALLLAAAAGALAYYGGGELQARAAEAVRRLSANLAALRAEREAAANTTQAPPAGEPRVTGSTAPTTAQPSLSPTPATLVPASASPTLAATDALQREVQALYLDWASTAARGDWRRHMNFYADQVDYYRDGAITRAKVAARKQRIFGALDAFQLRFAEQPQIAFKENGGLPEAEVTFDKQWDLRRGRRHSEGKARTALVLRRADAGWRIVEERQLKLHHSATRVDQR